MQQFNEDDEMVLFWCAVALCVLVFIVLGCALLDCFTSIGRVR